eukprot:6439695-Pyramimonas_sp.AAC.1
MTSAGEPAGKGDVAANALIKSVRRCRFDMRSYVNQNCRARAVRAKRRSAIRSMVIGPATWGPRLPCHTMPALVIPCQRYLRPTDANGADGVGRGTSEPENSG